MGQGLELQVLTAVLLGGVAFGGGRGSILGVAAGVLFIGVLSNGLLHVGVRPFWSPVSVGLALVAAAGLVALSRAVEARQMVALARPRPTDARGAAEETGRAHGKGTSDDA
jgi:ribose transport system permease protein